MGADSEKGAIVGVRLVVRLQIEVVVVVYWFASGYACCRAVGLNLSRTWSILQKVGFLSARSTAVVGGGSVVVVVDDLRAFIVVIFASRLVLEVLVDGGKGGSLLGALLLFLTLLLLLAARGAKSSKLALALLVHLWHRLRESIILLLEWVFLVASKCVAVSLLGLPAGSALSVSRSVRHHVVSGTVTQAKWVGT